MSACLYCYGRGWWWAWKVSRQHREIVNGDCIHCAGTGETAGIKVKPSEKLSTAIEWFKTSKPPAQPFKMWSWVISKPAMFWAMVRSDLESDFEYQNHRAWPEILKLYEMFGVSGWSVRAVNPLAENTPIPAAGQLSELEEIPWEE